MVMRLTRIIEVFAVCWLLTGLVVLGAYLLGSPGPTPGEELAQGDSPTLTAHLTTTSARCIWDLIPPAGRMQEDADKHCP